MLRHLPVFSHNTQNTTKKERERELRRRRRSKQRRLKRNRDKLWVGKKVSAVGVYKERGIRKEV
jgi:hypothetical protein